MLSGSGHRIAPGAHVHGYTLHTQSAEAFYTENDNLHLFDIYHRNLYHSLLYLIFYCWPYIPQHRRVSPHRCPLKCNARISEEERQKIFAEYWGLADYNLQREYLAAHMQREEKLGPSGLLRTVILYFLTRANKTKLQVFLSFSMLFEWHH